MKLKFSRIFRPCQVDQNDDLFPNGIFVFNDSCSRFTLFQKQMTPDMYKRISTAFKDEKFEKTSNSAERFARKVKRIQKSRYRGPE